MRGFRVLALIGLTLAFAAQAWAALKVGTLNCYFLVDPARTPEGNLQSKTPPPDVYAAKLDNLASLIGGLDVVGLQEVGSEIEAKALAGKRGYRAFFMQGKDSYTGQDVATLVAPVPEIRVSAARRDAGLGALSKHLVLELEKEGQTFVVLNVHLLRPFGRNETKHARQLQEINAWVSATRQAKSEAVVVVLGDFNNSKPDLLPLKDSARATGFAATHLDGKAIDRIWTSGVLSDVTVKRPPYLQRPNDLLKMLWTDHFLVSATVAR